eukprot:scaffold23417_cov71-Phaeocystis_antarctica.AAC.4
MATRGAALVLPSMMGNEAGAAYSWSRNVLMQIAGTARPTSSAQAQAQPSQHLPHPDGREEHEATDASPMRRILAAMAAAVATLGSRITIITVSRNRRVGMSRSSRSSTSSRIRGHSFER